MTKIICPCVECPHNGKNYVCKAKKIKFVFRNMETVNEGRVNMWVCSQYGKQIDGIISESKGE